MLEQACYQQKHLIWGHSTFGMNMQYAWSHVRSEVPKWFYCRYHPIKKAKFTKDPSFQYSDHSHLAPEIATNVTSIHGFPWTFPLFKNGKSSVSSQWILGKSSKDGPLSIAMFNYRRLRKLKSFMFGQLKKKSIIIHLLLPTVQSHILSGCCEQIWQALLDNP